MKEQKERARAARANISGWSDKAKSLSVSKTIFTGYESTKGSGKVLAIIVGDGENVDEIAEGECSVILDSTSFYGEGGGQVGDTGTLKGGNAELAVYDTKKSDGVYIHMCNVVSGTIKVGDTLTTEVDKTRRAAIARNHSAVHMLQAALRSVLGSHIEQAGSYVDERIGRFDFTHYAPLSGEQLKKVEELVNGAILEAIDVVTTETDVETARKNGAIALFGEKYGNGVRMVKMGDFSCELCGGTHIDNTSKAGLFKIISESSVAAGVRRIEVVTGLNVLSLLEKKESIISAVAKELKCRNENDMEQRAFALQEEVRSLKSKIDSLKSEIASGKVSELTAKAEKVGKVSVICADLEDMDIDSVRSLGDSIKGKLSDAVCVFAIHSGDKLNFIAMCGKDAVAAGAHAGNILKEVSAITGGKGGGRPDTAMSGGKDISKVGEALSYVKKIISSL